MFIWEAMATGAAFSKGYPDLAIFRIFIGLAEVGFKPCVIYYFATFCTRKEVGLLLGSWGITGFIAVSKC
jgi:MFS family permease